MTFGVRKKAFNGREKRKRVVFDRFVSATDEARAATGTLYASESVNCDCGDGTIRSGIGLRSYKINGTIVTALSSAKARKFFLADDAEDLDEVGTAALYCLTESGVLYAYSTSTRKYERVTDLAENGKCVSVADEEGKRYTIFSDNGGFYVKTKTDLERKTLENATTAICTCKDRVFIGVKPATVAYSDLCSPIDFTATKEWGGRARLAYGFGEIVAIVRFQNDALVFCERGVARIEVNGLATELKIEPLDYVGGEIYGDSAAVCGNCVFFLAADGAYRFDGKNFRRAAAELGIVPNPTVKECGYAICGGRYVLRYTDVDGTKRCVAIDADGKNGYYVSDREGLSQCGGVALCRSGSRVYALSEKGELGVGESYSFTTQATDFGVTGKKVLRKLRIEGEGSVNTYVYGDGSLVKNEMKYFVDGVAEIDVFARGEDFYFHFLLGGETRIRKIVAELSVATTVEREDGGALW